MSEYELSGSTCTDLDEDIDLACKDISQLSSVDEERLFGSLDST